MGSCTERASEQDGGLFALGKTRDIYLDEMLETSNYIVFGGTASVTNISWSELATSAVPEGARIDCEEFFLGTIDTRDVVVRRAALASDVPGWQDELVTYSNECGVNPGFGGRCVKLDAYAQAVFFAESNEYLERPFVWHMFEVSGSVVRIPKGCTRCRVDYEVGLADFFEAIRSGDYTAILEQDSEPCPTSEGGVDGGSDGSDGSGGK